MPQMPKVHPEHEQIHQDLIDPHGELTHVRARFKNKSLRLRLLLLFVVILFVF